MKDKITLEIIPKAHVDQVIFNSNENGNKIIEKKLKIPKRMKSRIRKRLKLKSRQKEGIIFS